jgi:hypothetical protein
MPSATTQTRTGSSVQTSFAKRGRGAPALKFLGSLRGRGALITALAVTRIDYQVDLFQSPAGRSGSGTLDGRMPVVAEGAEKARLRLSNGEEIAILLESADERGALFDVQEGAPLPA